MSGPYRLVAVDLDGTLLRSDGLLSARSSRAVGLVESSEAVLVFVTGRPWRWLRDVIGLVSDGELVVCLNGAATVSVPTAEIVDVSPLDGEAAAEITARLRRTFPGCRFGIETADSHGHEHGYTQRPGLPVAPAARAVERIEVLFDEEQVLKLLVQHRSVDAATLREAVVSAADGAVVATFSSPRVLEIGGPGATKARALARVAGELGLTAADVLAFCNMPNDTLMLAWAGHGVAVANAHPEALAAADEVTLGNDEDGVAAVLEREFDTIVAGDGNPAAGHRALTDG
jgi:Cof subfamily protein (haloacid dehalogenase superfamily)